MNSSHDTVICKVDNSENIQAASIQAKVNRVKTMMIFPLNRLSGFPLALAGSF